MWKKGVSGQQKWKPARRTGKAPKDFLQHIRSSLGGILTFLFFPGHKTNTTPLCWVSSHSAATVSKYRNILTCFDAILEWEKDVSEGQNSRTAWCMNDDHCKSATYPHVLVVWHNIRKNDHNSSSATVPVGEQLHESPLQTGLFFLALKVSGPQWPLESLNSEEL